MSTPYTRGDALGIYRTDSSDYTGVTLDRGGMRGAFEVTPTFVITLPIASIVVQNISGACGVGTGIISAATGDIVKFTAPNGTQGSGVVIGDNEAQLIEDADSASKWIRIYRDTDYNDDDIGGMMQVTVNQTVKNVIGMADINSSGSIQNYYAAIMLHNHEANHKDITAITAHVGTLGTQRTSDAGQLGGAGSGTITTTGSFSDWPAVGWCHIKNAGATREIVYYSSRTDTVLTVPSDGRGRLGTSAAAGANTDTLDAVPGIRIAGEAADSDGEIQSIASATTAPTGVTWDTGCTAATGVSIGTLGLMGNAGLWIHRETPANAEASIYLQNKIEIAFTCDGGNYTNTLRGHYSIADTTLEQYELYIGEDVAPDTTTAPDDTNSTPDFVYAVTPPGAGVKDVNVIVLHRNKYNLTSPHIYYQTQKVDSAGANANNALSDPINVDLSNGTNSYYILEAEYNGANDATPATHFRIYSTVTGVDPDPAIDTPADIAFTNTTYVSFNPMRHTYQLKYTEQRTYGEDLRVIMRTYNSDTTDESTSETVHQVTINTDTQTSPPKQNIGLSSGVMAQHDYANFLVSSEYGSGVNKIYGQNQEGRAVLLSQTKMFAYASILESGKKEIRIDSALSFENVAHSTAAPGESIIEYVSGDKFYLIVDETRRAMFDFGTGKIEADSFEFGVEIADIGIDDVNYVTDTAVYFQVLDPTRNRYIPWMRITSAGVLTFAFSVKQRRS